MSYKKILLIALCLVSHVAMSAEKQLEKESTVFNQTFSWQAMGGISALYNPSMIKGDNKQGILDIVNVSLLIDLFYKGFFIQSNHRRAESLFLGGEIGYQLIVKPDWEVDLISKTYLKGYNPSDIMDVNDKYIPTLANLTERTPGEGIGLRYSRYFDDAIFSLDLATLAPLSKANGWLVDIFYSQLFLYRNWDLYVGAGLTYYSDQVVDYFAGVDHDEINSVRAFYAPRDGYKMQFELYAQHPISKNWSFNAALTQSHYSNSFVASPIFDTANITQLMIGVIYVF